MIVIECLERRPFLRKVYVPIVTTLTFLAVIYDVFVR